MTQEKKWVWFYTDDNYKFTSLKAHFREFVKLLDERKKTGAAAKYFFLPMFADIKYFCTIILPWNLFYMLMFLR